MAIKTNLVGIEIDDKVYTVRKMSLGTQRRMVELQRAINQRRKQLLEQYGDEDKIPEDDNLELTAMTFEILDLLADQFVNQEEGRIVDRLDNDALLELITALQ